MARCGIVSVADPVIDAAAQRQADSRSHLDAALVLARVSMSQGMRGRAIIYADGWLSGHDPYPSLAALAQRGVSFEVVPISSPPAA